MLNKGDLEKELFQVGAQGAQLGERDSAVVGGVADGLRRGADAVAVIPGHGEPFSPDASTPV